MKFAGVVVRGRAAAMVIMLAASAPAFAKPDRIKLDLSALSDSAVTERLDTLESDLDRERTGAQLWQYGWTAFNGGTMIYDAVEASQNDNRKDRNTHIVRAVEGAIGVTAMFLRPLPALHGADPIRALPGETREERLVRLAAAEDRVRGGAERSDEPFQIFPHLGVFAINILAGIAVWQFADLPHAYRTVLPGILIGEAQLWTQPQAPANDLSDYRSRYGDGPHQASWWLSPREGGVEVTFRY